MISCSGCHESVDGDEAIADLERDHVEIHGKQRSKSVKKLLGYYGKPRFVWSFSGVAEMVVVKSKKRADCVSHWRAGCDKTTRL